MRLKAGEQILRECFQLITASSQGDVSITQVIFREAVFRRGKGGVDLYIDIHLPLFKVCPAFPGEA